MDIYEAIRNEVATNGALDWVTMTDQQIYDALTTKDIPSNRARMSGSEIWEATDATELNSLQAAKRSEWLSFCGIDSVDPFGPAQSFAINIFGGGSATLSTLQAARTELVSRADQLSLTGLKPGHIADARP